MMLFSETFLAVLVIVALSLTGLWALVLLILMIADLRKGTLW